MELLLILLAGGGAVFAGKKAQQRREDRRTRLAELDTVRRLAEEDTILLGEELRRLDTVTEGHRLDEEGRQDYQTALDAYESAQRIVDRLRSAEEVSRVVDALAAGRYAVARVRARVEDRPLPTRRTPCFFNPQHGPATRDVLYTQPGRGTRSVPACAQDAARSAEGQEPEVRRVRVGSRLVPYWEAGEVFRPYTNGYFPTTVTEMRRDHKALYTTHDIFIPTNYDGDFQAPP